ncbi:hypothetical protein Taro_033918 [Colocasia esculenta]|uniref:Uncharacterized protein n=1 Tax=Colocasia esculenta TaxID=4460 RepID=A0A843WAC7_COLES|nr:hypothetical protein [Colocasia esculenta]
MIRARAAGCSGCCATCVESVVAQRVRAVAARLALDSLAVVFLNCVVPVSGCCCAALEAEVHRLVALCSGEFCWLQYPLWSMLFGRWVVHSGEGSSQDLPLSLLVEVLPRSASCSFRATIVLPLWFEVCRLVGPHSGEVLPGRLLALFGGGSPQGCFVLFWLSLLSLSVEMSCRCCRLDYLCYSLLGHCRSRCCALGRASGCRVGQLVLLVVSKFSRSHWWDCVSPWLRWFASFLAPCVLFQMVVW